MGQHIQSILLITPLSTEVVESWITNLEFILFLAYIHPPLLSYLGMLPKLRRFTAEMSGSFSTPNMASFPLSTDGQSPPPFWGGGICLPNAPLSDIASLHQGSPRLPSSSCTPVTMPYLSSAPAQANNNVLE